MIRTYNGVVTVIKLERKRSLDMSFLIWSKGVEEQPRLRNMFLELRRFQTCLDSRHFFGVGGQADIVTFGVRRDCFKAIRPVVYFTLVDLVGALPVTVKIHDRTHRSINR